MKSIYLFTYNLRLNGNPSLVETLLASTDISFVYLYPSNYSELSFFRKFFLSESLQNLSSSLQAHGHQLYTAKDINQLMQSCTKDISLSVTGTYSLTQALLKQAQQNHIAYRHFEGGLMHPLETLPFDVQDLPFLFTDYRKKVEAENLKEKKEPPVQNIENLLSKVTSVSLSLESYAKQHCLVKPKTELHFSFKGGEDHGLEHLENYFSTPSVALSYKKTRNGMLNFSDSTKFSPWLALGCLSPQQILNSLNAFEHEYGANDSTYWIYFELLWRDFFKLSYLKHGQSIKDLNGFRTKTHCNKNSSDLEVFERWKKGETGQDFIDAHMKELKQTGWMSNRGRQNTANYFCHQLGLDWRMGALWFEHNLIDYDEASNWGNWAYQAGVGHDGRVRRFNPQRQAEMYDKDKTYRERFSN